MMKRANPKGGLASLAHDLYWKISSDPAFCHGQENLGLDGCGHLVPVAVFTRSGFPQWALCFHAHVGHALEQVGWSFGAGDLLLLFFLFLLVCAFPFSFISSSSSPSSPLSLCLEVGVESPILRLCFGHLDAHIMSYSKLAFMQADWVPHWWECCSLGSSLLSCVVSLQFWLRSFIGLTITDVRRSHRLGFSISWLGSFPGWFCQLCFPALPLLCFRCLTVLVLLLLCWVHSWLSLSLVVPLAGVTINIWDAAECCPHV